MRPAFRLMFVVGTLACGFVARGQDTPRIAPPRTDGEVDPFPLPQPETPAVRLDPPVASDAHLPPPFPLPAPPVRTPGVPLILPPDSQSADLPIVDELGPLPGEKPRVNGPKKPARAEREARQFEPPAPPRRGPLGGLLARIVGRPRPNPPASRPREEISLPTDDPDAVEMDRAAEADLKRQIEREIVDAVGDRVRTMQVRVIDRRAHVYVVATRFYFRKAVRRSIESLPSLRGLRATIEVD